MFISVPLDYRSIYILDGRVEHSHLLYSVLYQ